MPSETQVLPLTPLEEYFFWEDRPAYPCSCFIRLRFVGPFSYRAFQAAWPVVLSRHPLLASRVVASRWRGLQWLPVEHPHPRIQWQRAEPEDAFPRADHLDLREEIGIRFQAVEGAEGTDLVIQFHHACCDGVGIFGFIHELLLAYHAACSGGPADAKLPELDSQALRKRGTYGLTARRLLRMLPSQCVGLAGVREFLGRRPIPLMPSVATSRAPAVADDYPATCCTYLSREEASALRMVAQDEGATVNELLIRDLLLGLRDWRQQQGIRDDEAWMRLMIPLNMRTAADRRLPAADVVSSVFVDRCGSDCRDPARLLRGIHEQMEVIKQHDLGHTFLLSLRVCKLLPGGLRPHVQRDRCKVTCVLTNLGRLLRRGPWPRDDGRLVAGEAVLDRIDILAPFRPQTHAAVAVATYAGRLSVTLHYDSRAISANQGGQFMETFLGAIGRTTESAAVAGPAEAELD